MGQNLGVADHPGQTGRFIRLMGRFQGGHPDRRRQAAGPEESGHGGPSNTPGTGLFPVNRPDSLLEGPDDRRPGEVGGGA